MIFFAQGFHYVDRPPGLTGKGLAVDTTTFNSINDGNSQTTGLFN
jgi:hypothetical protein